MQPSAATPGAGGSSRRSRTADVGMVVEVVVELMRSTLSELLQPNAVDAALRKAQKSAAFKGLLSNARGGPKAAKTPGKLRSSYTAFVQECFHALKAAGIQSDLVTVGGIWKVLPAHLRNDLEERFSAVKCASPPPSRALRCAAGTCLRLASTPLAPLPPPRSARAVWTGDAPPAITVVTVPCCCAVTTQGRLQREDWRGRVRQPLG